MCKRNKEAYYKFDLNLTNFMTRRKKYIIWIIILLVIGTGVYFFLQSRKPKTTYITENAVRGDLAQTVSVTGEIIPKNEAGLSFQFGGEVSQLYVEIGDKVVKGQRVAQLKTGTLLENLAQAEKALEAQKQTYKDIKEKDNVYSDEQRRAQKAVVEQYESAAREAKVNLARTILYSPIEGVITQKNVNIGEIVTANQQIVRVMDKSELKIRADVPESDIVKIALNQKADVIFDALSSNEIAFAEVVEIDPASTVIQDVVYYGVKLKYPADSRIKPGMSVDVNVKTAEKKNVVMIPIRAVKIEGAKEYVEILKEKNITEKIFVITGLRGDDGMVEISSGLSGEENVITLTKTQ
jgi:RND family efflux transporter MFP subunit